MRAAVKSSSNEKQVAAASRRDQRRIDARVALVQTQLATYEGRQFVWEEFERHGIDDLVSGSPDLVNRFLGKREAGLELRTEVMTQHPERYLEMQAEAMKRRARAEREIDAALVESEPKDE